MLVTTIQLRGHCLGVMVHGVSARFCSESEISQGVASSWCRVVEGCTWPNQLSGALHFRSKHILLQQDVLSAHNSAPHQMDFCALKPLILASPAVAPVLPLGFRVLQDLGDPHNFQPSHLIPLALLGWLFGPPAALPAARSLSAVVLSAPVPRSR